MKLKRTYEVFTIIQHTRSGDARIGSYDSRDVAMERAEDLVYGAANLYGSASASVFRSTLKLHGQALQPRRPRRGKA